MNQQLQEYADNFTHASVRIRDLTSGLTDETFNRRSPSGGWSIAQIVDHLCILGELMLPRIDVAIDEARIRGWHNPGPFRYPFLSRLFIRSVGPLSPNKRGKMKAPKLYIPKADQRLDESLPRFEQLQTDLIARCERADGIDIARVVVTSPAAAWVRVRLGAWFEALLMHQLRHFQQIEDTLQALRLHPPPL